MSAATMSLLQNSASLTSPPPRCIHYNHKLHPTLSPTLRSYPTPLYAVKPSSSKIAQQQEPTALQQLVNTPLFRVYLPSAVFIGTLALIDAAYSGDWSRIGVITEEQELFLQEVLLPFEAVGHGLCGVFAGWVSSQRGEENWAKRAVKTLAGGAVTLIEVIVLPEEMENAR
jgi:hypothetical protein